ncbi:conserved hypothetical protein [Leishmania mexicana MHOM/GT/2001/U1103]|uniref:Uncharacterized protein n=1 Tax=Leishmania mexicana (strain MHOM/GT/2001/U1103) TaxID=929439 RepID=E9AUH3_LEIMU|nr:conserved hypothetical protein [Leishmania mexicana MHOM/GT/2001/U1103]CBZ26601.1 conserved hypothetical protein [Leishmania mexicana MHOM/GT/2001/U1103]
MTKSSPQTAKKFVESISLDIDVETTRQLLCSKKGFVALPSSIGVLCRQLRKLDLSANDLTDLSPLATLQHLSNLNIAHNGRLASLKGLSGTCLSVLNISFCAVESLEGLEHTALTLRTLIANDNRLQLHSPLLADVVAATGEDAVEMEAAREHLPESLRRSSSDSGAHLRAVAQRNYAIFSTFQQCETVVLSRNTRLCQLFPAWGVEEVAAECGEVSGRASAAADDEGSDDAADGTFTTMSADGDGGDSASRGKKHRASAAKRRNHRGIAVHPTDPSASDTAAVARKPVGDSPEMAAYNQRRHALALAHPLSVFERLSQLRKLSLSGCELHSLPVRWFLPKVTELRLAQNHLTSLQPDGVILRSLHILDISSNLFASVASLRRCRYLEQLNLRGNPLIEEGAVQDKAAGLTTAERIADVASTTSSAGASAVPIAVQQRLLRLFSNMKLLDGQRMMTAGQVRAAYMQRNARSAAEWQEKLTEMGSSDGPDIVASPHAARDDVSDAHAASDDSERGSSSCEAPPTAAMVRTEARSPARKARRVDSAVIAAEADEKDVVVEAPLSVVKTAHAPIVRRERVLLRPGAATASGCNAAAAGQKRKGGQTPTSPASVVYGQAAVAKLLEQSRSTKAW